VFIVNIVQMSSTNTEAYEFHHCMTYNPHSSNEIWS